MRSGAINGGSQVNDVLGVLSGQWDEFDRGEWHVVLTPFFLVLTATLDEGRHALPYTFKLPVAGMVSHNDGTVSAVVVKVGENAINLDSAGLVQFNVFGDAAGAKPA